MIDETLKACLLTVGTDSQEDGRPATIHLAETLWEMALAKDHKAIKMILDYVIGRPAQVLRDTFDLTKDVDEETRKDIERIYGPPSNRVILNEEEDNDPLLD